MDQAVQIVYDLATPTHQMNRIVLEKKFLDFLKLEVDTLKPLGGSYTPQLQRDVSRVCFVCGTSIYLLTILYSLNTSYLTVDGLMS